MEPTDFSANIERFSGFADVYDQYRPHPPAALADLLIRLAGGSRPQLVVDLGCGTGLSTRYWSETAERVIGVEPSDDMRRRAEMYPSAGQVHFVKGFSHQTGLEDGCAQIVTCSQALHWMEPEGTFREVTRILQSGGVFAAYDYDWPPTTGNWRADQAYEACQRRVPAVEERVNAGAGVQRWEKSKHLARMQASGCFRYTQEILLHHIEAGNAERLVNLVLSQGGTRSLLKMGVTESEFGLDELRRIADAELGADPQPWYWSSRVRIGIK